MDTETKFDSYYLNYHLDTYDKIVNKWKIYELYIWNSYPRP